jgi:hypothetical protein
MMTAETDELERDPWIASPRSGGSRVLRHSARTAVNQEAS